MEQTAHGFRLVPLKKILVALEFDPAVLKAGNSGSSSVKTINAEVILLHVLSEEIYCHSRQNSPAMGVNSYSDTAFFHINDHNGLLEAARYFLEKVKHHLGVDNAHSIMEEGGLAEAIFNISQNLNIDIIIICSHGKRWLNQILLGTNSMKVIQRTSVPVFNINIK